MYTLYTREVFMAKAHVSSLTLSVRVTPQLRKQIDMLAAAEGRTRSFIAEEALKRYVQEESWQVHAIHQAIEKAESKNAKFADHNDVRKWLKSWGSTHEETPPRCK